MPGPEDQDPAANEAMNEELRRQFGVTPGAEPDLEWKERFADAVDAPSVIRTPDRKYTNSEIHDLFHYHRPSENGALVHKDLSDLFTSLAVDLDLLCPNGREKSLAFTHLETAKMFASAAVARNPETR